MLASYKTSSVAVVMDCNNDFYNLISNTNSGGTGTVMDLRGKCLLSLTSSGEAFVLDHEGNNIATYIRPIKSQIAHKHNNNNNSNDNNNLILKKEADITTTNTTSASTSCGTVEVTTDTQQVVEQCNDNVELITTDTISDDISHDWYIGGMHISFRPLTWEVRYIML